jgi:hypothetical protein
VRMGLRGCQTRTEHAIAGTPFVSAISCAGRREARMYDESTLGRSRERRHHRPWFRASHLGEASGVVVDRAHGSCVGPDTVGRLAVEIRPCDIHSRFLRAGDAKKGLHCVFLETVFVSSASLIASRSSANRETLVHSEFKRITHSSLKCMQPHPPTECPMCRRFFFFVQSVELVLKTCVLSGTRPWHMPLVRTSDE